MKKLLIIIILLITIPVNASSIVMDIDSKRILYEDNKDEQRLIASTTKIMTAIIVIENNPDLNKRITVGEEVLTMYGTSIYLQVGEQMSIKDLLYGLILRSGNDAALVLAINTSKTEENFVKLMNQKAKELNMKNTIFQNSHGLDEVTQNKSTAYDMALLSAYAYKNPIYKEISSTKRYQTKTDNKSYIWYNRNKLLTTYKYANGGKNGYTPSSGRTLVTTASKNNFNLTVVTLNDPNEYETHEYLYNKAYSNYKNYTIIDKNTFYIDKNFYKENIYLKESFIYPLKESELNQIPTRVDLVSHKDQVGQIKIYLQSNLIGEIPIYKREIKQKEESFFQKFFSKLKSLFTS